MPYEGWTEEKLRTHPVLLGPHILRRTLVNPDLRGAMNDNNPTGSTRVEDGSYASPSPVRGPLGLDPPKECEVVGNPWLKMANGGIQEDEVESRGSSDYLKHVKAFSKDAIFGPNYVYKPREINKSRHVSNDSKESAETSFKIPVEKKRPQSLGHFSMKRFVDAPTNPPFNIFDPPPFLAEAQLTNYPGFEDVENQLVEGHWVETDIHALRSGWIERVQTASTPTQKQEPQSATFAGNPKPDLSPKHPVSIHGDPPKKPKPILTLKTQNLNPETSTSPTLLNSLKDTSPTATNPTPPTRFRLLNPLNTANPIVTKASTEDPQTFTIEGLICAMSKLFHPKTLPNDILSQIPDPSQLSDLNDPTSPIYAEFPSFADQDGPKKYLLLTAKEVVYLAFFIDNVAKKGEMLEEKCKEVEAEKDRAIEEVMEAECAVREVFSQHLGFESVADRVVLRWKLLEREVGVLAAAASATSSPTGVAFGEHVHERKKSDSGTAARFLAKELGRDIGVFVKTIGREKEEVVREWGRKERVARDDAVYWRMRAEAAEERIRSYERVDVGRDV